MKTIIKINILACRHKKLNIPSITLFFLYSTNGIATLHNFEFSTLYYEAPFNALAINKKKLKN